MENEFFDLKVLYVEDSDIIRNTGIEIIRSKVREVVAAKNGIEGLEMYNLHQPDLVITDIGMPEMDGLTMAKHIKKINPEALIIITTAFDENKFIKEAISIGVHEYILKSSLRSQLVMTINKWYDKIIMAKREKANFDFTNLISKKIIEFAPVIIMVTNANGLIEFVNNYFCEVTGFSQTEVLGKTPSILKSGLHNPDFYNKMWEALNAGVKWEGVFVNRKKNGEFYDEKAVIIPISQDETKATYYLKFAQQTLFEKNGNTAKKAPEYIALIENINDLKEVEEKIKTIFPSTDFTIFKKQL